MLPLECACLDGLFLPAMATPSNLSRYTEMSKTELAAQLARARSFMKSTREHSKRGVRLGINGMATCAGGITAGVLAHKMPKVPGLPTVDSDLALGALCQLGAFLDMGDAYNDQLNAFGAGLMAAGLARETQTALMKRA